MSDRQPPDVLRERIRELTDLLAQPPYELDVALVRGDLGALWLDLYDQTDESEALDQGLAHLAAAVVDDEQPDWPQWCYFLGLAYASRGQRDRRRSDYDEAVGWLDRLPADDSTARLLADIRWERHYLIRHGLAGIGPAELSEEADRLVHAVEQVRPGDLSSEDGRVWRRTLGLAYLQRYELRRERADLERGIVELAACVWHLPDDARAAYAARELAEAYSDRAVLDQEIGSLTLSIDTALRALARPPDGDELAQALLHQTLAYSSQLRWQAVGVRDDLERAIAGWRALVADGEPDTDWERLQLATSLRHRAELDASLSDVDEAVVRLEALAFADAELELSRLDELGHVLLRRGTQADDRAALARADAVLSEAIRFQSDESELLALHYRRLLAGYNALAHDARRPHDDVLASAWRLRDLLDAGIAELDRCVGAADWTRSLLAGLLAACGVQLLPHTLPAVDVVRLRDLLRLAEQLSDQRRSRPDRAHRPRSGTARHRAAGGRQCRRHGLAGRCAAGSPGPVRGLPGRAAAGRGGRPHLHVGRVVPGRS